MNLRTFALAYGVVFVLVGILGFVPGINQMHDHDTGLIVRQADGQLLGLFHVNLLHNLIHILFGIWGIMAYYNGLHAARMYARGVAVIYILLAVLGLVPGFKTVFGLVPIHGNDVWLHFLLGAVAAYFGFFSLEGRDTGASTMSP